MPKPLRVTLGMPRYRTIDPPAEDFLIDFLNASSADNISVGRIPAVALTALWNDVARERICSMALRDGADAVLMCDSDTRISGRDAVRLIRDCLAGGWLMLSAPICIRPRTATASPSLNFCLPPEDRAASPTREELGLWAAAEARGVPLEARGFVGTGVVAVNVAELRTMPKPWFMRGIDERADPETLAVAGADVQFCRRALAAGKRFGTHMGIRSGGHFGWTEWPSEEAMGDFGRTVRRMLAKAQGA